MRIVQSPAIQLATAEHEVELKELRNERAAAQTDVTRKSKLIKLQTSTCNFIKI